MSCTLTPGQIRRTNRMQIYHYIYNHRTASAHEICRDLDSAMKRARNVASPTNVLRIGLDTPCSKTGTCFDCKSPSTICCQFLITRYSRHPGRIHVILVNDELGF